jgi:mRNA interferase MazF
MDYTSASRISTTIRRSTSVAKPLPRPSNGRWLGTNTVLPQGLAVSGEVLNSHVGSIGTEARPVAFAGKAPAVVLAEVRAKLAVLMGIE